jgi:hypothetical protein
MPVAKPRTHLINRLTVIAKNLKASPENPTQDKRIGQFVDKIEHMMRGRAEIDAYRKINREKRAKAEEEERAAAEQKMAKELKANEEAEQMKAIEEQAAEEQAEQVA